MENRDVPTRYHLLLQVLRQVLRQESPAIQLTPQSSSSTSIVPTASTTNKSAATKSSWV